MPLRNAHLLVCLLLASISMLLASACSDNSLVVEPVSLCRCNPDQICVDDRCVSAADVQILPESDASSAACTLADVRINEVRVGGITTPDFIELTAAPGTRLNGYRLRGSDPFGAVRVDVRLAGLVDDDGLWVGVFGQGLDDVFDARLGYAGFPSPDGNVVLFDCAGTRLDAVSYGTFGEDAILLGEGDPAATPGGEKSLARCPGEDFDAIDTNDNAEDFVTVDATPGAAADAGGVVAACIPCDPATWAGSVWINEVLYDPSGADTDQPTAFVELRGVSEIAITGLALEAWDEPSAAWEPVIDVDGATDADGRFVLGESKLVLGVDQVALKIDGSNDAGGYRLLACGDTVIDAVGYGALADATAAGLEATDVAPDAADGESIARCPDGQDAAALGTFVATAPTPGADNTCP